METNSQEITNEMWNEVFKSHMPHINSYIKDLIAEEDLIRDKINGLISILSYCPKSEEDFVQKDLELYYAEENRDINICHINKFVEPIVLEHHSLSINENGFLQLLVSQKGIPCMAYVTTFQISSRAGERLKEFDVEVNW